MKESPLVNPFYGKLLKDLRTNIGMSQRAFAKAIGTTQTTICRWETGETTPQLTLSQVKLLLEQMKAAGLDLIKDFPSPE